MEKSKVSKRKRQALLVLPFVVIPFLTMAFWALGGGKDKAVQGRASGLNLQLPNAQLKSDASENKMSFYDQAEKDSAKVREGRKMDGNPITGSPIDTTANRGLGHMDPSYNPYPPLQGTHKDPNEEKVYQKLAELNQQLHASATHDRNNDERGQATKDQTVPVNKEEEEQLERTAQKITSENGEDTEMNNLNQMMEKVLDIQHPERVRERIKKTPDSNKKDSYSMKGNRPKASVSLLDSASKKETAANGFYSLSSPDERPAATAIEAVVHESQTLVDGAIMKFRLLQDVSINGTLIPKDLFVFGVASLNGERLEAAINSIRYHNTLLPVKLTVYDMDGLPGLYIPGAITRDVAKSSVDNAAQMLEITSLDPSLKAQATSAGLGAVKSLLSKKTKLVKVVVKGGYKVLLNDTSTH